MSEHAIKLIREIETVGNDTAAERLLALRWACTIYLQALKDERLKADVAAAWKKVHVLYATSE